MRIIPTTIDPTRLDPRNYCTIEDESFIQFKPNSHPGVCTVGVLFDISSTSTDKDDISIDLYSKLQQHTTPIPLKGYITIVVNDNYYHTIHESLLEILMFREDIVKEMSMEDYLSYTWKLLTFKMPLYSVMLYSFVFTLLSIITTILILL